MITAVHGDLLQSDAAALVNPINCAGIMGSGLALEFRRQFPQMHDDYVARCARGEIDLGHVSAFREGGRVIVNFPTTEHWRGRSNIYIIEAGMRSLRRLIETEAIESIAIPALGCGRGRLRWPVVKLLARRTIGDLHDVHIHLYAPRPPVWAQSIARQRSRPQMHE